MQEQIDKVKEFHNAFGHRVAKSPRHMDVKEQVLRVWLIQEELDEYEKALEDMDWVEQLDALTDMLYVIFGAAIVSGLDSKLVEGFNEVHRSNMSKLGADGKPIHRADGKIMKGENYTEPDLVSLFHN